MRLEGARALVTGATGGLGRAIARALHDRGATVVASGRREDALAAMSAELGERVEPAPADLSLRDDVDRLLERAGRVDVLVANAAVPGSGRLGTYTAAEVDRALDVNLRAPVQLARALLPAMLERGAGHLVFVSSLSGKVASGGGSIYAATKFGLRGFGFSLHEELHGTGVGATTVFPGFVAEAGMWADTGLDLPPGVRLVSPVKVADAVVKGVERNRAEIDVAPLSLRAAAWLAGPAPSIVSAISRRLGGGEVADAMAEAQREKR